jgi:hypothetical protein
VMSDRDLLKQAALPLLAIVITTAADASFQCAHAQCPADAKIYIDPRSVPQRQQVSRGTFIAIMTGDVDPALKRYVQESYFSQFQPIQIPFSGGIVLVSPNNPCVQQYIGR